MTDHGDTSILFPLHTSVELFKDRSSPAAVARAKEAAVLYDRLIFETGLLDVTVSSDGSFTTWQPPEALTPEVGQHARQVIPVGSLVTFLIGKEPDFGVSPPPEQMHVMSHGALAARYIAEFHTGVLDELAQFDPDWVSTVPGAGTDIPYPSPLGTMLPDGTPLAQLVGRLNFEDLGDRSLLPDAGDFARSFVYKAFNRDSVLALMHGSSLSVTPLFQPMVDRRGIRPEHAGGHALAITVPNVGSLPWEALVEFREHPGSQEARAKLREFEARGAVGDPERGYKYLRAVQGEVTTTLFQAIDELRPRLPEELAAEAVKKAVSLIPVVGPAVELTASVTQAAVETRRFNRSWIAALMRLRDRA